MTVSSSSVSRTSEFTKELSDRAPAIADHKSVTACVRCGQPNSPTRGFCESCGAALKLDCVSCGIEIALTERFCAGCGTNLEQAFYERWMEAHVQTLAVWRLSREFRFAEARAKATTIASNTGPDPRFEIFSQVKQVVGRTLSRRETLAHAAANQRRAEADAARGQPCMPALLDALSAIPATLREKSEEIELGLVLKNVAELKKLRAQIERALSDPNSLSRSGNIASLLTIVTRTLELDATDCTMSTLAGQLRERQLAAERSDCKQLIQQAKACVARKDYSVALRHIESISPSVWDASWDAYRSDLRELTWLEQELRQQPFVSVALLEFAQRLSKLSPNDSRPQTWIQELQHRLSRIVTGQARDEEIHWTPQREPTLLGPIIRPLSWPASTRESAPQTQSTAAKPIMQHLAVAYGVALQAIGAASIKTNLISKLTSSKRGRIFGRPAQNSAYGIDIGSHSVKVVRLSRTGEGQLSLFAETTPHETPLLWLENGSARHDVMVQTLRHASEKHDFKNCRIGISVSGNRSLGRYFELPKLDMGSKTSAKQLKSMIRFEAEAQIPFAVEDVCWESHLFSQPPGENSSGEYTRGVALVAARTSDLQQLLGVFEQAKISPSFAQAECIALYNFLAHQSLLHSPRIDQDEEPTHRNTVAIIECGAQTTNIVIGSDRHLWLRSFPFAGEEFTRHLTRELKITREQAETAKEQPWRAKRVHLLAKTLSPVVQEWAAEVNRSFAAYRAAHPASPVSLVHLSGGGSRTFLLARHLVRES